MNSRKTQILMLAVLLATAGAAQADFYSARNAVQGKTNLAIEDAPTFCTAWVTLYDVPNNRRLAIQWLSAESAVFGGGGAFHPVELDIRTWDGAQQIRHPLTTLEDPIAIGPSFFSSQRWVAPVRLYSDENQPVEVRMCFDGEFVDNQTVGFVTFSGYLVRVPN